MSSPAATPSSELPRNTSLAPSKTTENRSARRRHVDMRTLLVSSLVALTLFAAGLLIGFQSLGAFLAQQDTAPATEIWDFWSILGRNLSAALLLYAGVATGGIASAIMLPVLGLYVGATAKIGILAVGLEQLASAVWLYVPLEFAGCVLAGVAGMYPTVLLMLRRRPQITILQQFLRGLTGSLAILGAAVLLIIAGAGIEALLLLQLKG